MTEATVYRGALRQYRHPSDMLIISTVRPPEEVVAMLREQYRYARKALRLLRTSARPYAIGSTVGCFSVVGPVTVERKVTP